MQSKPTKVIWKLTCQIELLKQNVKQKPMALRAKIGWENQIKR